MRIPLKILIAFRALLPLYFLMLVIGAGLAFLTLFILNLEPFILMLSFIAAIIAFTVTMRGLPVIIAVAHKKKLVDEPTARKIHTRPIASLGGIAIFGGFFIGLCMLWPQVQRQFSSDSGDLASIVAASLVIFFLGVKDDIVGVSPTRKFVAQILAAGIIVFQKELVIKSFYGIFGITILQPIPVVVLSLLTIILIINAYNLIDGVDGLCALLGALSTSVFGLFFLWAGEHTFAIISFSMLGSLIAFLRYNLPPAKIFMGDTGSLLLGLVNSILALKFIEVASEQNQNFAIAPSAIPVLAMTILFVPLFDALRVFTIRLFSGRSPFAAEKNHIHHLLLRRGYSHGQLTACLVSFNLLLIFLAWQLRYMAGTKLLFIMIAIGTLGLSLAQRAKPLSKNMVPFPVEPLSNENTRLDKEIEEGTVYARDTGPREIGPREMIEVAPTLLSRKTGGTN